MIRAVDGVLVGMVMVFSPLSPAQDLLGPESRGPRFAQMPLKNPSHWMAIVGDSGVTGAASDLRIEPNAWNLFGHVLTFALNSRMTANVPPLEDFPNPERFGIDRVEPLTRVLYSPREFVEAKVKGDGYVRELNLAAKAALALDVAEHGAGYMIGRALKMSGRDIVLVGQDGKRVEAIPIQFERIFAMQTETLPPLVLVHFTANDFCDERIFSESVEARRSQFARSLGEAWAKTEPFLKPHPLGTRIVVFPPLEVANVLTNQRLLSQKVYLQGQGETSCRQIREGAALDGFKSAALVHALSKMCASVLRTRPSDSDRIQRIREIQRAFDGVWKTQIDRLNVQYAGLNLSWHYPDSARSLKGEAGDLANDCFHPGVRGHARYAEVLMATFFRGWPELGPAWDPPGEREAGD